MLFLIVFDMQKSTFSFEKMVHYFWINYLPVFRIKIVKFLKTSVMNLMSPFFAPPSGYR